eukprot:357778-Chlamydomonas_euryale.AAC.2
MERQCVQLGESGVDVRPLPGIIRPTNSPTQDGNLKSRVHKNKHCWHVSRDNCTTLRWASGIVTSESLPHQREFTLCFDDNADLYRYAEAPCRLHKAPFGHRCRTLNNCKLLCIHMGTLRLLACELHTALPLAVEAAHQQAMYEPVTGLLLDCWKFKQQCGRLGGSSNVAGQFSSGRSSSAVGAAVKQWEQQSEQHAAGQVDAVQHQAGYFQMEAVMQQQQQQQKKKSTQQLLASEAGYWAGQSGARRLPVIWIALLPQRCARLPCTVVLLCCSTVRQVLLRPLVGQQTGACSRVWPFP